MNISLSSTDLAALSPLLILLGGGLVLLLIESFFDSFAKKSSFFIAFATIAIAITASWLAPASQNPLLTPWLRFDPLAHFFNIFFLAIGLGVTLLSASFFQRFQATEGEFYFLLLSSLFGLLLIGSAEDFLTLFLGIETLSIPLYILCGYMKTWEISHESSIKYFLLGAVASAILLYGIAFIYGATGTTRLDALMSGYKQLDNIADRALFLFGIAFVTAGIGFKAAIVPLHVWAPDVYEGASNPVTAFMAVGTKAGAFAAFVRVFFEGLPQFDPLWNEAIAILAYPTLIFANYVAIRQIQLRRFFSYSGISHAGFLLLPLAAGTPEALSALLFYLVVYAIATLGAFAVLAYLDHDVKGVVLQDLHGLYHRSPWLSLLFVVCLLTLAGIPPTVGFFAKFYVFKVAFQAGYYGLVIVGLLTTILSAFYYLRMVAVMFTEAPANNTGSNRTWPAGILGATALLALALLSLFPSALMDLLQN